MSEAVYIYIYIHGNILECAEGKSQNRIDQEMKKILFKLDGKLLM